MRSSSNIGSRALFRNMLVANDGSEGARDALVGAIEPAQVFEAELHVMTVEEHRLQRQGSVISGAWRPKVQAAKYLQSAPSAANGLRTGRLHVDQAFLCKPGQGEWSFADTGGLVCLRCVQIIVVHRCSTEFLSRMMGRREPAKRSK